MGDVTASVEINSFIFLLRPEGMQAGGTRQERARITLPGDECPALPEELRVLLSTHNGKAGASGSLAAATVREKNMGRLLAP